MIRGFEETISKAFEAKTCPYDKLLLCHDSQKALNFFYDAFIFSKTVHRDDLKNFVRKLGKSLKVCKS